MHNPGSGFTTLLGRLPRPDFTERFRNAWHKKIRTAHTDGGQKIAQAMVGFDIKKGLFQLKTGTYFAT